MQKTIVVGIILMASTVFAHVPSVQDRYCGLLKIKHQLPPSCPTCTMPPSQYYIDVQTRTLDELASGKGFVQDHPQNLVVKIVEHSLPTPFSDTDYQIWKLQRSLINFLVEGEEYCLEGKISLIADPDGIASAAVEPVGVYQGTQ